MTAWLGRLDPDINDIDDDSVVAIAAVPPLGNANIEDDDDDDVNAKKEADDDDDDEGALEDDATNIDLGAFQPEMEIVPNDTVPDESPAIEPGVIDDLDAFEDAASNESPAMEAGTTNDLDPFENVPCISANVRSSSERISVDCSMSGSCVTLNVHSHSEHRIDIDTGMPLPNVTRVAESSFMGADNIPDEGAENVMSEEVVTTQMTSSNLSEKNIRTLVEEEVLKALGAHRIPPQASDGLVNGVPQLMHKSSNSEIEQLKNLDVDWAIPNALSTAVSSVNALPVSRNSYQSQVHDIRRSKIGNTTGRDDSFPSQIISLPSAVDIESEVARMLTTNRSLQTSAVAKRSTLSLFPGRQKKFVDAETHRVSEIMLGKMSSVPAVRKGTVGPDR